MLALSLFVGIGFIMSLVLHVINATFGVAIGLVVLALLIWLVVDIFTMPGMLHADRQRVEEEVAKEIVVRRGS